MEENDFKNKQKFFTQLYQVVYSEEKRAEQERVWQVLCDVYFSKFVPNVSQGVMVDLAAGYCNFINNVNAPNYQKFALNINEAVCKQVRGNVSPIIDEVCNLKNHFTSNSVDIFFQSHLLEHLPKEDILQLLKDEYDLLKPKGQIWILTPNIRYYKGDYWNLFDHVSPLTDISVMEVCQLVGFKPCYVEKKFLPGSLIFNKKPTYNWIIKLYFKLMPISGWFVGQQSFLILEKT